jgi:hypothetical protein
MSIRACVTSPGRVEVGLGKRFTRRHGKQSKTALSPRKILGEFLRWA